MRPYEKIMDWILVLFVLYLIALLVRRIGGGGVGFEEIVITALILNLAYCFNINAKVDENHWLLQSKKRRR